jgi:hypothetical protein
MVSKRLTYVLVVLNLLVLVGFGAWQYQAGKRKQAQQQKHWLRALPSGRSLTAIEIEQTQSRQKLLLRRQDPDNWQLQAPIEWPAQPYTLQQGFAHLQMGKETYLGEATHLTQEQLQAYGLDNPAAVLRFWTADSKPYTLTLGQRCPVGQYVYAMAQSPQDAPDATQAALQALSAADSMAKPRSLLLAVPEGVLQWALQPLANWQQPYVFTLSGFDVRGLILKHEAPAQNVIFGKQPQGWFLEAPIQTKADHFAVNALVQALLAVELQQCLVPGQGAYAQVQEALRTPTLRLTLAGSHEKQTLSLVKSDAPGLAEPVDLDPTPTKTPKYWAKLDQTTPIFAFPEDLVERLLYAQEDLRSRILFETDFSLAHQLQIATPQGSLVLQQLESGEWNWLLAASSSSTHPQPADKGVVQSLLEQLQHLQALAFVNDAPSEQDLEAYGLLRPSYCIEVQFKHHGKQELCLGHVDEQSYWVYAQLKDKPFVFQVSPHILSYLSTQPAAYSDKTLHALPEQAQLIGLELLDLKVPEPVLSLVASGPDGQAAPGPHNLVQQADLSQPDTPGLMALLPTLKPFKVHSYMEGRFDPRGYYPAEEGTQGWPWAFCLVLTWHCPDGSEQQHRYWFTERLSGRIQLGAHEASGKVFVLHQAMIDALFGLLEPHYRSVAQEAYEAGFVPAASPGQARTL